MENNNTTLNKISFNTFLQLFRNFGKLMLLLSKIIVIILTIYYLLNFNKYSFTFNIPRGFRTYSLINTPLFIVESLGMSLLIIPLTIIILSFKHKEIRWLQILSNFLSIGGNIFSVAHLMNRGMLEEHFRTFFITIFNAPKLETKLKLFINFFNERINTYTPTIKDTGNFKSFVQNYLDTHIQNYIDALKSLPQKDVFSFASKIADQSHMAYIKHFNIVLDVENKIPTSGTKHLFVFGAVVTVFVAFVLYHYGQFLKQLASEVVDVGKLLKKLNSSINSTDTTTLSMNKTTTDLAENVNKVNANIAALHQMHETLTNNENTNNALFAKELERLKTKYNTLEELIHSGNFRITYEESTGQGVPHILTTVQEQIKALAQTGLNTNKNLDQLFAEIRELRNKIENTTETRATSAVNINYTEAYIAADRRAIEKAKELIDSFNPSVTIDNLKKIIKTRIDTEMKTVAEHIQAQLQKEYELLKSVKDKNTSQIEGLKRDFNEQKAASEQEVSYLKTQIDGLTQNDTLNLAMVQQIKQNLESLKTKVSTIDTDVKQSVTKEDYTDVKGRVIYFQHQHEIQATMANDKFLFIENSISGIQSEIKKLSERLDMTLTLFRQKAGGVVDTVKDIHSDNKDISNGKYAQHMFYTQFRPGLGLSHSFFSNKDNNNNNNNNNNTTD